MTLTDAFIKATSLRSSLAPNQYVVMACNVYLARMRDDDTPARDNRDKIMVSERVDFLFEQSTGFLNGTHIPYTTKRFYAATASNVSGDIPPVNPSAFVSWVKITIEESMLMTTLQAVMGAASARFIINEPNQPVIKDNENTAGQIKMLELSDFSVGVKTIPPLPN